MRGASPTGHCNPGPAELEHQNDFASPDLSYYNGVGLGLGLGLDLGSDSMGADESDSPNLTFPPSPDLGYEGGGHQAWAPLHWAKQPSASAATHFTAAAPDPDPAAAAAASQEMGDREDSGKDMWHMPPRHHSVIMEESPEEVAALLAEEEWDEDSNGFDPEYDAGADATWDVMLPPAPAGTTDPAVAAMRTDPGSTIGSGFGLGLGLGLSSCDTSDSLDSDDTTCSPPWKGWSAAGPAGACAGADAGRAMLSSTPPLCAPHVHPHVHAHQHTYAHAHAHEHHCGYGSGPATPTAPYTGASAAEHPLLPSRLPTLPQFPSLPSLAALPPAVEDTPFLPLPPHPSPTPSPKPLPTAALGPGLGSRSGTGNGTHMASATATTTDDDLDLSPSNFAGPDGLWTAI